MIFLEGLRSIVEFFRHTLAPGLNPGFAMVRIRPHDKRRKNSDRH